MFFTKNLFSLVFFFSLTTGYINAAIPLNQQEQKEKIEVVSVSPISAFRAKTGKRNDGTGTLSTVSKINEHLKEVIQDDKSLSPQKKNRLLKACSLISQIIKETAEMVYKAVKITPRLLNFVFSIKGFIIIAALGCLSEYLTGSDYLLMHVIAPVTEKFASYIAYLTGNVARNVVIGLHTPLKECLSAPECTAEIEVLLLQLKDLVAFSTEKAAEVSGAFTQGVAEGAASYLWNNPVQALISASIASLYGAFELTKIALPAFVLARARGGR